MSVRLADQSFQHLIGITENMLVEVGKFTFLVDFMILEMEEDSKVPLILGGPFFHTVDAIIRWVNRKTKLKLGEIEVFRNLDKKILMLFLMKEVKSFILSRELFSKKNSLLNLMNSWQ
ncbi:reverse transcriptase domain-containing protein [Tanacetum coccineum]|uniref:Reverse transcriptase domain-containing protein n=1 Tax=Tanacetum coccineum TaxID=301880 RepID=A0ABQ5HQX6_9ASTR